MKKHSVDWRISVVVLVLLSFVLGTSEFIVIGILPNIADGLHTDLTVVGSLVSVFAGSYAIGTPIIAALTSRINKFRLMMAFMTVFLLGNLASTLATNVAVMYISRIAVAVVSGPILSVSMIFAKELVPSAYIAQVMSYIFSGFSIASVLGVPIGTVLTQMFSYRAAFVFIILSIVVLMVALACVLPKSDSVPCEEGTNLLQQFVILKDGKISLCIGMILCSLAGTYVVYTYFTPILQDVMGFSASRVSVILLLFGLCSIASNLLSGKVGEQNGLKKLPVVYLLQIVVFGVMLFVLHLPIPGLIALFAMGVLMYVYNTSAQLHFLNVTEQEYPYAKHFASSLLPMSSNIGIAVGSLCGSLIQKNMGFSILPLFALAFEVLALICVLVLNRKMAQTSTVASHT